MLISVKTFNGHTLNDSSYETVLRGPRDKPNAAPVFLEQADADAQDAGIFTVDVQTRVLTVRINNYANRTALASQLMGWFKRGTQGDLVVTFTDDGVDYQLNCRVVNCVQDPDFHQKFNVVLQTGVTAWRSVSLQTDTWNGLTGTGGNKTISVGGDDDTRLIASVVATAAPSSGFFYQNMVQFPNVPGINWGYRAWCLTINTAALVTASKMRSDCFDLRIYNGDTEIRRWINGANTTTTKVWFNANMRAGASIKLKTAINNSETVTTLQFNTDATTKNAIKAMATSGIIYHGTEWFSYTATDYANARLTISKRGIWGTTKQAHSAGDAFAYIENPIRMVYGNLSATDPSLDDSNYDTEKPVFNLASSDNTKWVYDSTTVFYDPVNTGRTGQWGVSVKRIGTVSTTYQYEANADSGNPVMGIQAGAFQVSSVWKPDTIEMRWTMACPGGFSKVTATGRKWKNTATWLPAATWQHSVNGTTWITLWTEATPSSLSSWTSWASHSAVTIPNTAKFLSHTSKGTFGVGANGYAMSEAQTVTVEFYTTNIPTATLLGETNNYPMNMRLSNGANSDLVTLAYPALYDLAFLMDGENYAATFDNVSAHKAVILDDESRADGWLRLKPGSNTLTIAATDVGTLNIALSWYRRRL